MHYVNSIQTAAGAPDHDFAQREAVSLDELLKAPFLALEAGLTSAFDQVSAGLKAAIRERGLPAARLKERGFPSIESLLAHLRAGQGWTLLL